MLLKIISANDITTLNLGISGTSNLLTVEFDLSDWVDEYGEGTPVLLHRRSMDKKSYPVAAQFEDGILTWVVTSIDTAWAGYGKAEVDYVVEDSDGNNVVVKSQEWRTITDAAIDKGGIYPDHPESNWVENMLSEIDGMVSEAPTVTVEDTIDGVMIIGSDGSEAELYDGEAATIEVGTVTTVEPEEEASVVNSGTSNAAIFDFEIPKGEKGDTGNLLWPELYIDADTGELVCTVADAGPSFNITEDGILEVSYI